jgi:hypothetical protein
VACAAERVATDTSAVQGDGAVTATDRERLRFLAACADLRLRIFFASDASAVSRLAALCSLCPAATAGGGGGAVGARYAMHAVHPRAGCIRFIQCTPELGSARLQPSRVK